MERFVRKADGARGFTFIELMISLMIVGVLTGVAIPMYQNHRERIRVDTAIADIAAMSAAIKVFATDAQRFPESLNEIRMGGKLDPWGYPYRYLDLTTKKGHGASRKDKRLNPLNSDFDLYSVGKDGDTSTSLNPKVSRDDVIRARDGRFIGLARDFDP
jgi:general secretion pathway protein G